MNAHETQAMIIRQVAQNSELQGSEYVRLIHRLSGDSFTAFLGGWQITETTTPAQAAPTRTPKIEIRKPSKKGRTASPNSKASQILQVIEQSNAPVTAREIDQALGLGTKFISSTLCNLEQRGEVEKGGKRGSYTYSLPGRTPKAVDNPVDNGETSPASEVPEYVDPATYIRKNLKAQVLDILKRQDGQITMHIIKKLPGNSIKDVRLALAELADEGKVRFEKTSDHMQRWYLKGWQS